MKLFNFFNSYNDKKKDAIDKIINFVKNIEKIPKEIRKMKLHLLLSSIIKNKNKQINDIKNIKRLLNSVTFKKKIL